MCYDSDEPADIWECEERRARKEHTCTECRKVIPVKGWYKYYTWLSDGHWSHAKICEDCIILTAYLYALERSEGCREWESWPPIGGGVSELYEDLYNRGLQPYDYYGNELDLDLPPNHPEQRRVVRNVDLDKLRAAA